MKYLTLAHFRHFSPLFTNLSTTPVENLLQISSFLTNKANFRNTEIGISSYITSKYEISPAWRSEKTNPIQTQFKPNFRPISRVQSQFKPNFILDVSLLAFLSGDKPNWSEAQVLSLSKDHQTYHPIRVLKYFLVNVAVGCFTGLVVIILVVFFCRPERISLRNLSFNVVAFRLKRLNKLSSYLFLFLVEIENRRAILRAYVRALAVKLCKIVRLEKQLCNLLVADYFRVERDLDGLGMAGFVGADLLVGRIRNMAARISDGCGDNAGYLIEIIFRSPETAGCEYCFASLLLLVFGWYEIHRKGVHTMASILRCHLLSEKHMAEMAAAVVAENLRADAVGVGLPFDGAFYLVVEAGPAAVGLELRRRFVKRCPASRAGVGSFFVMVVIFAAERAFGAFVNYNALLLAGKFVIHFRLLVKSNLVEDNLYCSLPEAGDGGNSEEFPIIGGHIKRDRAEYAKRQAEFLPSVFHLQWRLIKLASVLFAIYPNSEGHLAGIAFCPQVNAIMPDGIDVAVIIQYGFSAEENQAFIAGDKLLYVQAGSAIDLHEIFAAGCAVIFRLV